MSGGGWGRLLYWDGLVYMGLPVRKGWLGSGYGWVPVAALVSGVLSYIDGARSSDEVTTARRVTGASTGEAERTGPEPTGLD